jgi:hypothetical protein
LTSSRDLMQAAATPIASSPIVLAVPRPEAESLGWAGARLTWTALLEKMNGGATFKAGIVEPGRDAASLNILLALNAVAASMGQGDQEAIVAALRALAVNRSAVRADLLARFARAGDPTTLRRRAVCGAAAVPE